MKAEGMPQQDDRPSECQNCGALHGPGYPLTLQLIDDIFERVAAEEPMPSGQCEHCGALCHLVEETGVDEADTRILRDQDGE